MGKGDFDETYQDRPLGPDLERAEPIRRQGQEEGPEEPPPPEPYPSDCERWEGAPEEPPEVSPDLDKGADTRARLSIRTAVDRFLARLERGDSRVFFPWPGTPAELPDDPDLRLPRGALTPELDEEREKAGWRPLWVRVGPLWPDRLVVLVGATGRGKSGFAVQVAESVARFGAPVLYGSAEMGTDELVARLVAMRALGTRATGAPRFGVGYGAILRGKALPDELRAACDALVKDCPNLYLWEPKAHERNALALRNVARGVFDGRPPFLVLDYVQRFVALDEENRREGTSAVSGALRDISKPGGLGEDWPGAAVLALSSTARANYEHFQDCLHLSAAFRGGRVPAEKKGGTEGEKWIPPVPLEGMGKETGELEYDAPLLLCMTTDKGEGPGIRPGLLVVAKNRHGALGAFRCSWWPVSGRFEGFKADEPVKAEPAKLAGQDSEISKTDSPAERFK